MVICVSSIFRGMWVGFVGREVLVLRGGKVDVVIYFLGRMRERVRF